MIAENVSDLIILLTFSPKSQINTDCVVFMSQGIQAWGDQCRGWLHLEEWYLWGPRYGETIKRGWFQKHKAMCFWVSVCFFFALKNYGGGMRPPLNALVGPGMPGMSMWVMDTSLCNTSRKRIPTSWTSSQFVTLKQQTSCILFEFYKLDKHNAVRVFSLLLYRSRMVEKQNETKDCIMVYLIDHYVGLSHKVPIK